MAANVTLTDDLLAQAQWLAEAEGKTTDVFTAEAVKREVGRKLISRLKMDRVPSGMTEDEETEFVVTAVDDYRRGR